MNEDYLPELSESEKEEIQKEAEAEYPTTYKGKFTLQEPIYSKNLDKQGVFIAGASLQLRKAKKREAELMERIKMFEKHYHDIRKILEP